MGACSGSSLVERGFGQACCRTAALGCQKTTLNWLDLRTFGPMWQVQRCCWAVVACHSGLSHPCPSHRGPWSGHSCFSSLPWSRERVQECRRLHRRWCWHRRCDLVAMRGNQSHWRGQGGPAPHVQHQFHGSRFRLHPQSLARDRESSSSCNDCMAFRLHIGDGFANRLHMLGRPWCRGQSRVSVVCWQAQLRDWLHVF